MWKWNFLLWRLLTKIFISISFYFQMVTRTKKIFVRICGLLSYQTFSSIVCIRDLDNLNLVWFYLFLLVTHAAAPNNTILLTSKVVLSNSKTTYLAKVTSTYIPCKHSSIVITWQGYVKCACHLVLLIKTLSYSVLN